MSNTTKLSPLAEQLFSKLNTIGHISDPFTGALQLSQDPTVSAAKRVAYAELAEYLATSNW
jgi:hypothetical protein